MFETIHLAALGLWLGAIVMSGVAAFFVFPTVKKFNPSLPDYSGFTGDHWLLLAGRIANQIFVVADGIQFVCASLCIVTMLLLFYRSKMPFRHRSAMIRVGGLGLAVCIFGFYFIYLRPLMDLNMRGYWEAAQAGNNTEAVKFQAIFNSKHPLASRLMGGIAVTVFITLLAAAWNATTSGCTPPPVAEKPKRSKYEEPALLRSRR